MAQTQNGIVLFSQETQEKSHNSTLRKQFTANLMAQFKNRESSVGNYLIITSPILNPLPPSVNPQCMELRWVRRFRRNT